MPKIKFQSSFKKVHNLLQGCECLKDLDAASKWKSVTLNFTSLDAASKWKSVTLNFTSFCIIDFKLVLNENVTFYQALFRLLLLGS